MPHVDARALPLAASAPAALPAFEAALARVVAGERDALAPLDDAFAHAPSFAMGHALRAAALVLSDDPAQRPALAHAIAAIEQGSDGDARARRHAAAARAWLDGDAAAAGSLYGAIADEHPLDILALRVAHALDFRSGARAMLRDRVARALPHWDPAMPHYGHVVAMHAFGLEENGDYDAAEAAARHALDHAPRAASAIHVLAHVCEMRGRAADGIALLERTRAVWSANAAFARHLEWHLAVFHLDQCDTKRAQSIYDEALAPHDGDGAGALVDASALLWRLELRGVAVPGRWRALARGWARQRLSGARAFNIVHAVAAQAGARQLLRARRTAALLDDDAATRRANDSVDVELARAFCAALIAFARGRYGEAVDLIGVVRARADECGGSVAQCDLIHLTLIEAALRGARDRLARALVAERALRRPASRLSLWLSARLTAHAAA